jgi:hypothetical protein
MVWKQRSGGCLLVEPMEMPIRPLVVWSWNFTNVECAYCPRQKNLGAEEILEKGINSKSS